MDEGEEKRKLTSILQLSFQDLYVFVSEQEDFVDFNNSEALVWSMKGLEYGDWYSGENGDGTYTGTTKIKATEVRKPQSGHKMTFIVYNAF